MVRPGAETSRKSAWSVASPHFTDVITHNSCIAECLSVRWIATKKVKSYCKCVKIETKKARIDLIWSKDCWGDENWFYFYIRLLAAHSEYSLRGPSPEGGFSLKWPYSAVFDVIFRCTMCSDVPLLAAPLVYFTPQWFNQFIFFSYLISDPGWFFHVCLWILTPCLFLGPDESLSVLPGQQEPSASVLPDAVSPSSSLPLDGSTAVPETFCWC